MVTIKEVAKRAGVSHGTVSNVINKSGKVSSEKIVKVERAMKELGYKPNVVARNLKEERTKTIALVLPDFYSKEFLCLYENLNRYAAEDHYSIQLFVTDEIVEKEKEMLNTALMQKVEAAVIVTCQPDEETFFDMLIEQGLKLIFVYREPAKRKYHFIGMDIKSILEKKMSEYFKDNLNIALIAGPQCYSAEQETVNTYFQMHYRNNKIVNPQYIATVNYNRERAMEAAFHLLNLKVLPDVIITTNERMAEGIITAFSILERRSRNIILCVLAAGDWTELEREKMEYLYLDYYRIGKEVYEDFIHYNDKGNRGYLLIETGEYIYEKKFNMRFEDKEEICILLNKCPSSEAIRLLLPDFEDRTGIHVKLVTEDYKNLYKKIIDDKNQKKFDIYSIDLPWMQECVENQRILPLDDMISERVFSDYSEEILKKYSMWKKDRYAVPYSYTIQLLFYRKDLFEELRNQRLYFEKYKEELRVPQSWREYNQIAKFFTRKYNPMSETEYGTTMGGSEFSGAFCEFLPRLWEQGGEIGDIQDASWKEGIRLYKECMLYANPNAVNWWWNEQVEEFYEGNAAMMIMYTEHIGDREHRANTPVNGKVGVALLPGKTSVLGGWSLGVREGSEHKNACQEFFKWLSLKELWIPNAVLGRVIPCQDAWHQDVLGKMYEWFPVSCEGYRYTKERYGLHGLTERKLEERIGKIIHEVLCGNMSVDEAVEKIKNY